MKFLKLDLLTLLISLFLFASCENTSTIGLEVDPSLKIEGTLVDTLSISSRTVADQVASGYGLTRYPLGYLADPTFGKTEAALAMSVNVPADAYDFGTSPVLDSVVLVLPYNGEFYGDSTSNYNVEVFQLNKNFSKSNSYLANVNYDYNSTVLGAYNGKVYPATPFKVMDVLTDATDTLKSVVPQMRIKLSVAEMTNRLLTPFAGVAKYNSYFNEMFKGLYVQLNKANTTAPGGIMFFDFTGTNANLAVYYRKQDASLSTAQDTVSVNFPIIISTNPVATKVAHDYTGTAVKTQLDNPTTQYAETYVQAMGGVRTKLEFPYLNNFTEKVGKVAINKAELVIDVKAGTDPIPFNASPRLALYRYDLASQRKNVPDNDSGSSTAYGDKRYLGANVFGGYFNAATRQYVFVVTAYLQDLLDKKTENFGTYIAPSSLSVFEYLTTSYNTASRAVLGSHKKSPASGEANMKLNVYYTKVSQ